MYGFRIVRSSCLYLVLFAFLFLAPGPVEAMVFQWSHPYPTGEALNGIAWGGGKFVAVGDGGVILTSTDGKSWAQSYAPLLPYENLYDVAWGGGKFVAVGTGLILTSTDGVSWSRQKLPTNAQWKFWYGVASVSTPLFHGFVAVGEGILTSPNGMTWTVQTAGAFPPPPWYAVSSDGQSIVVVGAGGGHSIMQSYDGVAWGTRVNPAASDLAGVVGVPGQGYVAVGSNGIGQAVILSSPDGINWTSHPTGVVGVVIHLTDVCYAGYFYAVGFNGANPMILTSPGGVTWTPHVFPNHINGLNAVAGGGGQIVTVGGVWYRGTIIMVSVPAQQGVGAFTRQDRRVDSYVYPDLFGVSWAGNQFVAVGTRGMIMTGSPDGLTWKRQISGTTSDLYGIAGNGNRLVAVGAMSTILTSQDGVTWMQRYGGSPGSPLLRSVTWSRGLGRFVAVGNAGTILTSPDGLTWTPRASGTTQALLSVIWGGNQYVAVGLAGTILTSPDGISWTPRTSGTTNDLDGVAWGQGKFVAVGYDAVTMSTIFLTSTDGITWTAQKPYMDPSLDLWPFGIAWGGGKFVVAEAGGIILASSDGISWQRQYSGVGSMRVLRAVALGGSFRGGGHFVVVGDGDAILHSIDAPVRPGKFSPRAINSRAVRIQWQDVAYETSYTLYRRPFRGKKKKLATLPANRTSFVDRHVQANRQYQYFVVAANEAGMSAQASSKVRVLSQPRLSAFPLLRSKQAVVKLTWSRVKYARGYLLQRKDGAKKGWKTIRRLRKSSSTYLDKQVLPKQRYWYRLKATALRSSSSWVTKTVRTK